MPLKKMFLPRIGLSSSPVPRIFPGLLHWLLSEQGYVVDGPTGRDLSPVENT